MNVPIRGLLWAGMLVICGGVGLADEPKPEFHNSERASGESLPPWESTDEQGLPWKSSDHVGKKILVLYFYPGDFTGGCVKQAQAFREGLTKLEEQGVELVGVSGDEVSTHKLFKESHDLKHTLLSDTKGELAKSLGIPVGRGGNVRARTPDGKLLPQPMRQPDGTASPWNAESSLLHRPVTLARWTIILSRDGEIASVRRNVNPASDAQEVLAIVASLVQ